MIYNLFQQITQLVTFSGSITYDSNGFAVLPSYAVSSIMSSLQPASKSDIKFLPEGTHYADYYEFFTDYVVNVDNLTNSLGSYLIYNNNLVYKIISSQNFQPFVYMFGNHIEGIMVRDNRLTFNGTVLNLPLPEIDGEYGSLFQLIAMVNSCFTSPTINTLWSFQQELKPAFPYCTLTIENVENIDNTNYINLDVNSSTLTTNISKQLIVKFSFYAQDQIQALNLMEQFKLNYAAFAFATNQLQFIGFVEESNPVENELYEDRTTFHADVRMRFSWIVQETATSTQTINTVAFTLSIPST